jgi:hypothetical protein
MASFRLAGEKNRSANRALSAGGAFALSPTPAGGWGRVIDRGRAFV